MFLFCNVFSVTTKCYPHSASDICSAFARTTSRKEAFRHREVSWRSANQAVSGVTPNLVLGSLLCVAPGFSLCLLRYSIDTVRNVGQPSQHREALCLLRAMRRECRRRRPSGPGHSDLLSRAAVCPRLGTGFMSFQLLDGPVKQCTAWYNSKVTDGRYTLP